MYAVLCTPAIGRRGYPPIDPAWMGVTFLWVSPVLLAATVDLMPFAKRYKALAMYCIATAFFDAGTMGGIVPRNVSLLGTIVLTVVMYGPLHLVVGFVVDGMIQAIRAAVRFVAPTMPGRVANATRWTVFGALLLLTCAFPFAFRADAFADLQQRGRSHAEQDWRSRRADIYVGDFNTRAYQQVERTMLTHNYDRATGLEIRPQHGRSQYEDAYNRRIRELLNQHGVPEWSMKDHIVSDDDLINMLDSEEMNEIGVFPYDVNANITLMRRGPVTRWGVTSSKSRDDLSVLTRHHGSAGGGLDVAPVHVGQLSKYPEVVFVRNGRSWIGAFHDSGRFLSSADRYESRLQ